MPSVARFALFSIPLLLIVLTIIAGYAYSEVAILRIPIPKALGLLTIMLPLITGFSTRFTQNLLVRSSKKEQSQLTIPILFILGFQLIYETVIVTLTLTKIIPPSSLNCGLQDKWQEMYSARDENALKTIQDRFQCCGFKTITHQPWPFNGVNGNTDKTCSQSFGRTKPCLGEWKQAQQINAGLFLLVAIVVFIIKLASIMFLVTGSSWSQTGSWVQAIKYGNGSRNDNADRRNLPRRLIDSGESGANNEDGTYRDDVEDVEDVGEQDEQGPRVIPSGLGVGGGNPWGNERESSRAAETA